METLRTPFGVIKILIDGREGPYFAQKGKVNARVYPDVLGVYRIEVSFVPDGQEHSIACIFEPECSYKGYFESGEDLECQGFYNDRKYKMSIGVVCESGWPEYYGYDADYLANGMSYLILPSTKTEQYVFGIAWIDKVGCDDTADRQDRGVQTWFAADPSYHTDSFM